MVARQLFSGNSEFETKQASSSFQSELPSLHLPPKSQNFSVICVPISGVLVISTSVLLRMKAVLLSFSSILA